MGNKKQQRIYAELKEELNLDDVHRGETLELSGLPPEGEDSKQRASTEKREKGAIIVLDDEQHDGPERGAVISLLENAFTYIDPGTFLMGSPNEELGRQQDEDEHEVTLTHGFYIQKILVTQRLWRTVMGTNPSFFSPQDREDELPVEGVSWFDCQEFITRLNNLTGHRYRLPTEAEWEYACRAGSDTAFSNGPMVELYCELDPILDSIAWYCGNSKRRPHAIATKSPNQWGIYDMHGNLWEWCEDWYGRYLTAPQVNPKGPRSGTERVVRGGSWFSNAMNCRSASRFAWDPTTRSDMIGFRLIRDND